METGKVKAAQWSKNGFPHPYQWQSTCDHFVQNHTGQNRQTAVSRLYKITCEQFLKESGTLPEPVRKSGLLICNIK